MKEYTLHINLFDLAFLATIFIGLTLTVQLWFTNKISKPANRILALALASIVLQIGWILGNDTHIESYFTHWTLFPLQFSLATGPLIFFYVLKITKPDYKFRLKDLLHFIPLLLALIVYVAELRMNSRAGIAGYSSAVFYRLSLWIQVLVFVSISAYLYGSRRLIEDFYQQLKLNGVDRYRYEFQWLNKLLTNFSWLWLLWIPYVVICYFRYHQWLDYPLYILLSGIAIWLGVVAHSKTVADERTTSFLKPSLPIELRAKATMLKNSMRADMYYKDSDISLNSLAQKLDLTPHELSRIINTVLKKNFSDFINEYRVADVIRKIQDPENDNLTLVGIATDSGFNSKSTFNRIFKEMTGKSPAEYKTSLKNELPIYNMGQQRGPDPNFTAVISNHNTTMKWYQKLNRSFMFRNYLKIAWRNTLRNKAYSALNIAGLAAGMAVALLIGLWIYSQYSYNRFLPGYAQLYQVKTNFYHSGEVRTQSGCSLPLVEELRTKYPEVKYASETDWGGQHSLVIGDKKLYPYGITVGTDFLKMFPYPMLKGNSNTAFSDANSIILTESIAKALFGNEDPLNKTLRLDNKNDVVVKAVMKDVPTNSTLQFTYLLPYSLIEQNYPETKKDRTNWGNHSFIEYVELQPGADVAAFENKIKDLNAQHEKDANEKIEVILQPAKNWRLLTEFKNGKAVNGFIQYVRMFAIIGILVLVIACINFVNLSTARAEKRAREVGVRKAIGSSQKNLIIQFLTESLLITFLSFIVSIGVVQLVLPSFNSITYSSISIPYGNGIFWCIMLGYLLITALLAGCRPAFYLSSFQPVKVLKGTIQLGKSATLPRKVLVVVQFSCSIALIISTLVIYQQIEYAKNRPKGYDADNLVMLNSSDDLNKNFDALKHDLLQSGQVISITRAASTMTYFPASFDIKDFPGKKQGESVEMATTAISSGYFKTIGTKFIAGHDYEEGTDADTLNLIINEAAAKQLRLKEPLNQLITFDYRQNPMRVIGVVESAIVGSPFYSAGPALYVFNPGWSGSIMFRMNGTVNKQEAIKKITAIFNKYNPSYPFDYSFADEAYSNTYKLEELVGTLAGLFAGLAIFISCLGLFGLAAYVAEQRKKEIGIRKVLGASVSQVWFLLSSDFVTLVIISSIIASPLAFYFLHGWLQKYDYRISIGPAAFLIAAIVTVLITVITVSYQAISTALTNPVKSLRTE
ncbi:MAG: ABC transporter permease [Chitinophagaceae bacterium]